MSFAHTIYFIVDFRWPVPVSCIVISGCNNRHWRYINLNHVFTAIGPLNLTGNKFAKEEATDGGAEKKYRWYLVEYGQLNIRRTEERWQFIADLLVVYWEVHTVLVCGFTF